MKGKMILIMGVLLIASYFLYEWKGNPRDKNRKKEVVHTEFVTGTITDHNGSIVSKATVYLLGSDEKTYSDSKGMFEIPAKDGDELIISHPRYKIQSVNVKKEKIDVILRPKDKEEE
ncbi:MAG: carboxypeptidase-like regulatory domain-containing protein [Dysgonomonas sp.]